MDTECRRCDTTRGSEDPLETTEVFEAQSVEYRVWETLKNNKYRIFHNNIK